MTNRVVKTKYDEDNAVTILKPLSSEHEGKLIVVFEDAYGDLNMNLMTEDAVKLNYYVTDEEIEDFKKDEQA